MSSNDSVNHPAHYTSHPSGVECIDIVRHMSFNIGGAIKYLWRADLKSGGTKAIEDLEKARFLIEDEIKRRKKSPSPILQSGIVKRECQHEFRDIPSGDCEGVQCLKCLKIVWGSDPVVGLSPSAQKGGAQ